MGPHPAVAAARRAVRESLADLTPGGVVLVACSGGPDSLALLAAACFESRRPAHHVVAVTVDHGLQVGSRERAAALVPRMRALGAQGAEVATATVAGPGGPEAAARTARYAALEAAADRHDAATVLLGHTLDDQAETVLLGLARGSGARSLSGMEEVSGRYRRPLLGLRRADTLAACRAQGIEVWEDPHNADLSFTRARVRHAVLPVLEEQLGPGVADALARTASLLRDDADALDALAADALTLAAHEDGLVVDVLAEQPRAVRRRVIRLAALAAGCPSSELFSTHVVAVDALVGDWRGQRWVDLPGHVRATRDGGILRLSGSAVAG